MSAGCTGDPVDTAAPVEPTWSPAIVTIDRVACAEEPAVGEVWQVALTADDPQGADTVVSGSVSVQNEDGGELGLYALECADGRCAGSFRADYDGIPCAAAGTVTFVFEVVDDRGHASPSEAYTG